MLSQKAINYGKHLPMAVLANVKHGFPGRKLKVIGVTGTDGKTTTVNMIYSILKDAGKKVSMVSTINAEVASKKYETGFHVTSPHPSMIQGFLAQSVKNKDDYFVLEITSHALDQFRTWGVPIEIGVVTNITREHLDYHKTMENYLKAKAKLIEHAKYAVLNKDDESFTKLSKMTEGKVVSVSLKNSADLNLKNFPVSLKIPGEYNYSNALQAAAVAQILGIDQKSITGSLNKFKNLAGRMEEIPNKQGIKVVVDFAHTPNALENACKALKKQTNGRLIVVFGAASQRDAGKRPIMGQIAARFADITVLTSEDPRLEDPLRIIDEITAGMVAFGGKLNQTFYKEPDRKKAIEKALSLAKKGDVVGIFGKGHEKTMNIAGKEIPWSDQEAVQKALK